jgi:ribosomal protein S12 methylthiotransferase
MTRKSLTILGENSEQSTAESCSTDAVHFTTANDGAMFAGNSFGGNVALVTLGCAKNLVDSEVMLGVLQKKGFRLVGEPENADLIVVNTCAFLQSAVKEGIDTILSLSELKKSGRCKKLIVAGCMVERYRADLITALPEVDRFLSTDELLAVGQDEGTATEFLDSARRPYFLYDESMPRIRSTRGNSAYIKIAEGCDRPCAFCIIPKIRGAFRSRPIESVLAESRALLSEGIRELNLIAQDLTSYGVDHQPHDKRLQSQLPDLLRAIQKIGEPFPPFWIRLLYAYPIGITEELCETIRDLPSVANYLDLPLQHISGSVLKAMRRPLGERNTRALIEMMRTKFPEIALRTTFVVGFPGETDADVEALRSFVAEGHFTHVGVFPYSQEEEAAAFTFENQVPERERERRQKIILEAQQEVVRKRAESLIGTKVRVLIEGHHEETEFLISSRAEWQTPEVDGVIAINETEEALLEKDPNEYFGKFGEVEITGTLNNYDFIGKLVSVEM